MVSERLDLTDEHKSQLDRLFIENRRNLIELRSRLETEQLNLAELLDREPFDESALMAQYRKLESARSRLAAERFQYLLEVRRILGSDRFRRLEAIYGTFRDRLRRGLSGDDKEPAP
jgi:Spy/CpxP family protein refolding chaperone